MESHVRDGERPFEDTLGEYGRNLGLAFQIVDDVLDLTANEEVLGKPAASDLREGKATLAVIHALERGTGRGSRGDSDGAGGPQLCARGACATFSRFCSGTGRLAYAMDTACAYAEAARQSIADLPESDYKRALLWVPGFVTSRDR